MRKNNNPQFKAFKCIPLNMWEIKQYKPLALVFFIDGNGNRSALPLDDTRREQFKQVIENSKMVELEWIIINTYDIKEIRPASKTTEIEKFFYSRDYQERAMISQRVRNRANNQKANVLECLAEMWTGKAIEMMQQWIEWSKKQETETQIEENKNIELTEEQKQQILGMMSNLKKSFSNKH